MSKINDFLSIFNCVLKDNSVYSIEELSREFLSFNEKEKMIIYQDIDSLNNTLLMDSIDNDKDDLAFALIHLGFDTNSPNLNGLNPLIKAIKSSKESLALHLIDFTIDLDFARSTNLKKIGDTALIYATNYDMLSVIKKLIDKGANPLYTNEFEQSALFHSISKKQHSLEIFEYLLPFYKEEAFINDIRGHSIVEKIFSFGEKKHLEIIRSELLEFPNLTQEHLNTLKKRTIDSYRSSHCNQFKDYQSLLEEWDKMKEMIKIQNKFKDKSQLNTKNKTSKI